VAGFAIAGGLYLLLIDTLRALAQLISPRASSGAFRAIEFTHGGDSSSRAAGRRALAEALGSLGPNTIVLGIDPDRGLILAHQLWTGGDAAEIDVLELG
jgi:hypothetical protein